MDIAKRNPQNPIMRPSDLKPGIEGMEIVCLLNPGVFRYNNKIWLLLRVAERPKQIENKISFPIYNKDGKIEILSNLEEKKHGLTVLMRHYAPGKEWDFPSAMLERTAVFRLDVTEWSCKEHSR